MQIQADTGQIIKQMKISPPSGLFYSAHVLDMIINSSKEIYVATFKRLTAYSTDLSRTLMSFASVAGDNDCNWLANRSS